MSEVVLVSGFSSVLEIAFGLNLVFLVFEVQPVIDQGWSGLWKRFERVSKEVHWRVLSPDVQHAETWLRAKMRVDRPAIAYVVLGAFTVLMAALNSLWSLGSLIACGFNPGYSLSKDVMTGWLLISFLTVPLYVVVSRILLNVSMNRLKELAKSMDDKLNPTLADGESR